MEKNTIVDHLAYNNPYERFMIMILERLEKLEDNMENIDNKMSIVMGNLTSNNKNIHLIFKIILDRKLDVNKMESVYNFLHSELACTQCFFSLDFHTSIQIICTDNSALQKFSNVIDKFKSELKIMISKISIEPDIAFDNIHEVYMLYKQTDSAVKKIKLHTMS